ncbi:MAG: four helix bundle protein [Saprospiraceae bacterium]|nr:four helix bundle protein [Saprospiraceae bacterium]
MGRWKVKWGKEMGEMELMGGMRNGLDCMFTFQVDFHYLIMKKKHAFVKELKDRTKKNAINVILLLKAMGNSIDLKVIKYQLVKSATSVAANYRASCLARSQKEFHHKLCIVSEEIDETLFWLEIIKDLGPTYDNVLMQRIVTESQEINRIIFKAKMKTRLNENNK